MQENANESVTGLVRAEPYLVEPRPQALGSLGSQLGMGRTLTRLAVTLFWVEAEEVCVVATAPVRTITATRVRTMFFTEWPL
jgi:hypothetical protein